VQQQHVQAQATVQQEAQQAREQEKQGWQEQRAALEKQHLQVLLRSRQALEEARQQWQKERDELVQQLTAQHTASGMQVNLYTRCPHHFWRLAGDLPGCFADFEPFFRPGCWLLMHRAANSLLAASTA